MENPKIAIDKHVCPWTIQTDTAKLNKTTKMKLTHAWKHTLADQCPKMVIDKHVTVDGDYNTKTCEWQTNLPETQGEKGLWTTDQGENTSGWWLKRKQPRTKACFCSSTNMSLRTPQKHPLRWGWLGGFVPNWTSILSTFHRQKLSNSGKFLTFLQSNVIF